MGRDFLEELPPEARAEFVERMVLVRHRRDQYVWHEKDPSDGVHIVVSGHLAVRTVTLDAGEAMLTVLGPGDVFGEMEMLDDRQPRTASVVALEPSETGRLAVGDWDRLRSRHREIDAVVAQLLAGYVIRLGQRLSDALFMPAETRVVRQLAAVSGKYRSVDSPSASVRLTGQQLAELAGVSRQTVSSLLGQPSDVASRSRNATATDLRELGVQVTGRGQISIPDVEALADFAAAMKQSIRT